MGVKVGGSQEQYQRRNYARKNRVLCKGKKLKHDN